MISECDIFEIKINIKRIVDRSFYFEYEDNESDDGLAIYDGAGIWFLETIVAPMYYMNRIDYNIIARYFAHEITPYHDKLRGFFEISNKYIKQIRKITRERKIFTINYIYTSMENLRAEGYADFNARMNGPIQDINMDGVKIYNANLEKLGMYRSNYRAGLYYDKEIGFENLTPSSEYSNGRYMCLTIALYVAVLRKKSFQITVNNNTISSQDIDNNNYNLNDIMSNNKIINIVNLDREVLKETLSIISTTNNDNFIKLYEQACNLLKIKDNNRVMTLKRYGQLIEKVKNRKKNS
jgi:hypothetical protein